LTPRPESIVRRKSGAESTRLGRDCVVLDSTGEMLRGLNGTAARVWELADGRKSIGEISSEIALEYTAPVQRVLKDVVSFVERLLEMGLLEYVV
jgi:pyrroloquinoline quinone biosynthesis protein D